MENFVERLIELDGFIQDSTRPDFVDVMNYIKEVLIPHCSRMERVLDGLSDDISELNEALETSLEIYNTEISTEEVEELPGI